MTRKKILVIEIVGLMILAIAIAVSIKGSCSANFICDRPHDDSMAKILFPIIPLFIFSLITYKMRQEMYQAWWKFARIWIPLSMLAVLISPSNTSNWMFPIEKGTVAFFSSCAFVIISLVIIAYQYFQRKK